MAAVEGVQVVSHPEIAERDGVVAPTADEAIGEEDIGFAVDVANVIGRTIRDPRPQNTGRESREMTLRVTEGGTTLVPSLGLPSPFPPPNGAQARNASPCRTEPRPRIEPTRLHLRASFCVGCFPVTGPNALQRVRPFFMACGASVTSEQPTT